MTAYWTGFDGTVFHADTPAEMLRTAPLTAHEDAAVLVDEHPRGTDWLFTGTLNTVAAEWGRRLAAK